MTSGIHIVLGNPLRASENDFKCKKLPKVSILRSVLACVTP